MIPRDLALAEFSDDGEGKDGKGLYRFTLWRRDLQQDGAFPFHSPERQANQNDYVQFIGLNPSTATETINDNTITRCIGFATRWGYGALCMTNIFAWRDTSPADMKKAAVDPTGDPRNLRTIVELAEGAGLIVAAWSSHGAWRARHLAIREALKPFRAKVRCFGITAATGQPEHPLYVAKDRELEQLPL